MQSGVEQLRGWMDRKSFNQADTARFFGWHESVISQYLSGARRPNLPNAVLIEEHTGIPVKAWQLSRLDRAPSLHRRTRRSSQSSRVAKSHVA